MSNRLTRRGASDLTALIDRVANTVQHNAEVLGIDPRIARDFAWRCDLISDAVAITSSLNAEDVGETKSGPISSDADEPYMKTFTQEENSELEGAVKTAKSTMEDIQVNGYEGFVDQIRALDSLNTRAVSLDERIQAAVGPLLTERAGLEKEMKKIHEKIKDDFKESLGQIGNVTIARKTKLVSAIAKLQVVARKRTINDVQEELLVAVVEKYGAEVAAFIKSTTSALQDAEKALAVSFKGFELEERVVGKTASGRSAGLADLLSRFQSYLSKGWRKLTQLASAALSIVTRADADVEKVHDELMNLLDSKTASLVEVDMVDLFA